MICSGCFVSPAKSRYAHVHVHQPCYEQHVIMEDKQSVGIIQLHSAVINNLSDIPDALPSLVLLVPCQSILKGHCAVPQWTPLFSFQCCHTGAVNGKGLLSILGLPQCCSGAAGSREIWATLSLDMVEVAAKV